ncbi:MAG: GIY-YIG nuclease family protein [Patescibacteria group bacterium]
MYSVYILKSLHHNRYYVGHTENIVKRLIQHNNGKVRSTKGYRPWRLVYQENFSTKQLAYRRELLIKSYKHGEAFKKLIEEG